MRRGPEAAHIPLTRRELLDLDETDRRHRGNDELRDPHSRLDNERLLRVGVQEYHPDLPSVAGVDQPGRVDDPDPVARGETGTRLHKAGVALRYLDCDPGTDDGARARRERDALARNQIDPGVAFVRVARKNRVVAQPSNGDVDHRAETSASVTPATRNRANRGISRLGSRA